MAPVSPSEDLFSLESTNALTAGALGFMPRILVLTTLPHRRPESNRFERVNGRHSLLLEARRSVGLPYGIYPRLILAYLTTAAVRSKSPEIELGRTPSDFTRRLGLTPISGKRGTVSRLQDQLERLRSIRLNWQFTKDFHSHESGHGSIVTSSVGREFVKAMLLERQPIWRPKVVLSLEIFQEFTRSAVPIDLRAVHQLKGSPLAIDIYVWLTHRMSYLRRPCLIPWEALKSQFGSDYSRTRDFRRGFLTRLKAVVHVYPNARVQETDRGLHLYPSPSHVLPSRRPSQILPLGSPEPT